MQDYGAPVGFGDNENSLENRPGWWNVDHAVEHSHVKAIAKHGRFGEDVKEWSQLKGWANRLKLRPVAIETVDWPEAGVRLDELPPHLQVCLTYYFDSINIFFNNINKYFLG